MNMLLEAAMKPQKKKTITKLASAPVLVGCWFVFMTSVI
jgi:hypothetical protein